MRNLNEDNITQAVIARHAPATDVRFRELMTSLVQHLHAFAREVKLTEAEWLKGINFLTDIGRITEDGRNEFVLLSDALGLSMLVTAQNHRKPKGCTEPTAFGPCRGYGTPHSQGDEPTTGASVVACLVRGRVLNLEGQGIAGADVVVRQEDAGWAGHGERSPIKSGADGAFEFQSAIGAAYSIPHDGPTGWMLKKLGRHHWRPVHLHFAIRAPGYQPLVTDVFREGDLYLDSDAVFGVRQSLITDWAEQADGSYVLDFDFVLNRNDNTQQAGEAWT